MSTNYLSFKLTCDYYFYDLYKKNIYSDLLIKLVDKTLEKYWKLIFFRKKIFIMLKSSKNRSIIKVSSIKAIFY